MKELMWFAIGMIAGGTAVGWMAWNIFLDICMRVARDALDGLGYDTVRRGSWDPKPRWLSPPLTPIYANGQWLR